MDVGFGHGMRTHARRVQPVRFPILSLNHTHFNHACTAKPWSAIQSLPPNAISVPPAELAGCTLYANTPINVTQPPFACQVAADCGLSSTPSTMPPELHQPVFRDGATRTLRLVPEGAMQRAADRLHSALGFQQGSAGDSKHMGAAAAKAPGAAAAAAAGAVRGASAWQGPEEEFWDLMVLIYGALRRLPVMVQVRIVLDFGWGLWVVADQVAATA